MLFFGPGDFSQGIGAPGEWTHSKLKHEKWLPKLPIDMETFAGTVGNTNNLDDLLGYHFINVGQM
jgi:4-hydroxy-2-oxoheptanedioate aldolase